MEYRSLCEKMLESHPNIRDVFMISSDARLLALSGADDAIKIDDARLAELMEDLLFMVSSRRRYRDLFGTLQYIHIRHTNTDTLLLPFEADKVLCVCLRAHQTDVIELLLTVRSALAGIHPHT